MTKLNKTQITFIQKEFLKQQKKAGLLDTPSLSIEKLKKNKIPTKQKSFDAGNLRLKQDLLLSSDYSINLIDKNCSLDGIPLKSYDKLLDKIQKIWLHGDESISYEDMMKLNIFTSLSTIKIGNFKLSAALIGSKFIIDLIDSEKDGYGRWNDSAVNTKRVKKALDEYKLSKKNYKSFKETTLNGDLEKHLRKHFDNCSKSRGNQKGIFDLEIGSMNYVIEIKMASSAKKSSERDRADGQMKRYLSEFKKKENFMMLIAGEKGDLQDHHIRGIKKAAEKDYGVNFYFLEAK